MDNENRIALNFNTTGLSDMQQKLLPLLVKKGSITRELERLNEAERVEFGKLMNEVIEGVNAEHTRLTGLMGQAIGMPTKQLIWESNHLKVTRAITTALARTGCMPTQAYIVATTGLNRKTVQAHLEQGDDKSVYAEHLRQYTMMTPKVMDVVLNEVIERRDMKAAKMYFEILEKLKGANPFAIYNTQHNCIQINNTVIRQETISLLNPEQLKQIEEFVQKNISIAAIENESAHGEDAEVVEVGNEGEGV